LRAEIRLAAHIGARHLVVHRTTLGLEAPDFSAIADLAIEAADCDVILALENGKGGMSVIRPALEAVPALGFCLDISHAYISMQHDGAAPETIVTEWAHRLVEVHISDAAHNMQHGVPGTGAIAWQRLLAVLSKLPPSIVLCMELICPDDPLGALRAGRTFLHI
jgi:sugar phosphate isomerase/epimerase